MSDLRHDEPCSSPSPKSVPVDTATLTERLEAKELAATVREFLGPKIHHVGCSTNKKFPGACDCYMTRNAPALEALASLETRLAQAQAESAQWLLSERRAVAAEAREKALRETLGSLLQWAKRYRGGDTSLDPEEWFIESEHAERLLVGVRGEGNAETGGLQSRPSGGAS